MSRSTNLAAGRLRPRILCVEDDHNVGATVQAVLGEEGYDVSCLFDITDEAIRDAIDRLQPDCILLDSASPSNYSRSWEAAASIRRGPRSMPVIMFTAHVLDIREARANVSERARNAGFAAALDKPFTMVELLDAVALAVRRSRPYGRRAAAEAARRASLHDGPGTIDAARAGAGAAPQQKRRSGRPHHPAH